MRLVLHIMNVIALVTQLIFFLASVASLMGKNNKVVYYVSVFLMVGALVSLALIFGTICG